MQTDTKPLQFLLIVIEHLANLKRKNIRKNLVFIAGNAFRHQGLNYSTHIIIHCSIKLIDMLKTNLYLKIILSLSLFLPNTVEFVK